MNKYKIVSTSAIVNEIQIPFAPNTNDNAHAKPTGNMNPSSREMEFDNLFFCIA